MARLFVNFGDCLHNQHKEVDIGLGARIGDGYAVGRVVEIHATESGYPISVVVEDERFKTDRKSHWRDGRVYLSPAQLGSSPWVVFEVL